MRTQPMGVDGKPLEHYGRGYWVAVNTKGQETTPRAHGDVWGSRRGEDCEIFLSPDEVAADGRILLHVTGRGLTETMELHTDAFGKVLTLPIGVPMVKRDRVWVDWADSMHGLMA